MATCRDFLARVLPWPAPGEPGVCNLHWFTKRSPGVRGRPYIKVDDFMGMLAWGQTHPGAMTDIYFCLSRQSRTGKSTNGKATAARHAANALALKAIWLDVDVKDPPKGYASLDEAITALEQFLVAAGLPKPSALVGSGGGLHVYWISDRPLAPDEWRPYAEGLRALAVQHGLRCDYGITTDAARILRVPNTLNHKTNPPKPVRLLGMRPADYVFSTDLAMLAKVAPITVTVKPKASTPIEAPWDAAAFAGKQPAAVFAHLPLEKSEPPEIPPLEFVPIMQGCPFFRDAVRTNGKDHSQPIWNLAILATTFMNKGEKVAHLIGSGHPGYTPQSTDAMYQRKVSERSQRNLGWPTCQSFEGEGVAFCKNCPHKGKIKSPLNLARQTSAQKQNTLFQVTAPPSAEEALHLPANFQLDNDGYIVRLIEKVDGAGNSLPASIRLFQCKISEPVLQHQPQKGIRFKFTLDMDRTETAFIPQSAFATPTDLSHALNDAGVLARPGVDLFVKEFFMSWLGRMREIKHAISMKPFGWYIDPKDGEPHGFIYNGTIFKDDGTEISVGVTSDKEFDLYTPTGRIEPWHEACKMVCEEQRPELQIIIAAAFGSPLMFRQEYAGMISVYSAATGIHKSTALKVSAAVWGHPKLTPIKPAASALAIEKRMGVLRHLPLYADELKDEDAVERTFDQVWIASEGATGQKLHSNRTSREQGEWQLITVLCSNPSFLDHVVKRQPSTEAGAHRVFEFLAAGPTAMSPGQINTFAATPTVNKLESNYGYMGLEYSRYLGQHAAEVLALTTQKTEEFAKDVQQEQKERIWVTTCGAILAGAEIAIKLGAPLDYKMIRAFLVEAYIKLRERVAQQVTAGGTLTNTDEVLTMFLKQYNENTLWTDAIPARGRPRLISVHKHPLHGKPTHVQWSVAERLLRFEYRKFVDYLVRANYTPSTVVDGLKQHYGAEVKTRPLGSGTEYAGGPQQVLIVPVRPGSWMDHVLMSCVPPKNRPGDYTPPAGEDIPMAIEPLIETGIMKAQQDLALVRSMTP